MITLLPPAFIMALPTKICDQRVGAGAIYTEIYLKCTKMLSCYCSTVTLGRNFKYFYVAYCLTFF